MDFVRPQKPIDAFPVRQLVVILSDTHDAKGIHILQWAQLPYQTTPAILGNMGSVYGVFVCIYAIAQQFELHTTIAKFYDRLPAFSADPHIFFLLADVFPDTPVYCKEPIPVCHPVVGRTGACNRVPVGRYRDVCINAR